MAALSCSRNQVCIPRINRKLSASCVDEKGCADAYQCLPNSYVPNTIIQAGDEFFFLLAFIAKGRRMPQQAARVQWQPKGEPNLRGTQAAGCESRTDLALEVGNRRDQGSNPVPLDLEAASFPLRPSGPVIVIKVPWWVLIMC